MYVTSTLPFRNQVNFILGTRSCRLHPLLLFQESLLFPFKTVITKGNTFNDYQFEIYFLSSKGDKINQSKIFKITVNFVITIFEPILKFARAWLQTQGPVL